MKVPSRRRQPGKIFRLWARSLLVSKWTETIFNSNARLFACKKASRLRCVCVYLEISVNTRSFKNSCSTLNSYLFHSNSFWFLLQQTTCSTKFFACCAKFRFSKGNFVRNFAYPNEILSEISFSVEQNAMQNFARLREISMIWEYWRKFAFFEISHNRISSKFDEICSHYFCLVL